MEYDLDELTKKMAKEYYKNYELKEEDKQLIAKAIRFYMNPSEFLEEMFEVEFNHISSQLVAQMQRKFKQDLNSSILQAQRYFRAIFEVMEATSSNKNARELFVKDEGSEMKEVENKEYCEALTRYLEELIQETWADDVEIDFGDGLTLIKHPSVCLPQPHEIKIEIDNE
mmetsp:Transcript_28869/g.43594  ORF Transcript_28869/g.43594 Transcript_28869/m.43594 type:complete len:170 (+) Transcript_28869:1405-1914(+)|eukprot:CAMPEP_0170512938 /NCGR_PEP_ID=MMETSP0208-20121228/67125_1 /TAXON_ID=197538 /ORGANISM="Strombidium inclinatum, Strain S3" /LENGTH=169 /DNA_ID=CAMNT_0010796619 /DNA_START=1375 /DNA_END=1884 /DNA_ORIENTATION=-